MDGDDPLPDCSDDLAINWSWFTTLGNLVWDISSLADDDVDTLWSSIGFLVEIFFLPISISIFLLDLAFSELCMDDLIMDDPEYTCRLA